MNNHNLFHEIKQKFGDFKRIDLETSKIPSLENKGAEWAQ